jgi:hypothetical protein
VSPHSFRRRGRRRDRTPEDRGERRVQQPPLPPRSFPACPVCAEAVRDLAAALTHRPTGRPAHFDCILKELRDQNPLGPQEKLCYLGSGVFGVLTWRQEGNPASFVIKRRIPYEDPRTTQDWKRELQAEGQAIVGLPVAVAPRKPETP